MTHHVRSAKPKSCRIAVKVINHLGKRSDEGVSGMKAIIAKPVNDTQTRSMKYLPERWRSWRRSSAR